MTLAAVIVGSFLPDNAPGNGVMSPRWWSMGHIPAYALLAFLTVMVVRTKTTSIFFSMIGAGLAVGLFGLGIELLQPFVGRMASVRDVSLNAIGILLGLAVVLLAIRKTEKHTHTR